MEHRTLTELENRILDFAETHDVAALERDGIAQALAAEFGWRPVTYLQRLFVLIDDPAADRERPLDVRRLRRLRDVRRAARLRPFAPRLPHGPIAG